MSYDAEGEAAIQKLRREAMQEARVQRSGPVTRADKRRAEKIMMKQLRPTRRHSVR